LKSVYLLDCKRFLQVDKQKRGKDITPVGREQWLCPCGATLTNRAGRTHLRIRVNDRPRPDSAPVGHRNPLFADVFHLRVDEAPNFIALDLPGADVANGCSSWGAAQTSPGSAGSLKTVELVHND